jgi:hypothetical protein
MGPREALAPDEGNDPLRGHLPGPSHAASLVDDVSLFRRLRHNRGGDPLALPRLGDGSLPKRWSMSSQMSMACSHPRSWPVAHALLTRAMAKGSRRARRELLPKQLRRGTHRSTRALEDAIRLYLGTHNEEPKPFVWIKTADEIFASIQRFCLRTSETGH